MASALVALVALPFVPAIVVAAWVAAVLASGWLEERYEAAAGPADRRSGLAAPAFRVFSASLYAGAALALIILGQAAAREFAFALLAMSMLYVLMRYYPSPAIVLAGAAPPLAVMIWVGVGLTQEALARGALLAAFTPTATVVLVGVLMWAARGQLTDGRQALLRAMAEAQDRARAADAANQAKSNFLAVMSHELRTPLNGVLGMAQAMTADDLSAEQRERVKIIRRSGESLLSVLNDLLDLSKIEAGAFEAEISEFDLAHLARGVVAGFSHLATKKGLSFEFTLDESAQGACRGDPARLRRVLYALVANAVKFTEAGQVGLAVRREGEAVLFRVSDTGVGVAADQLPHLFDNFFQADSSNTRRFGGAGIGLAICRDLVGLMGGTIEVASVPGEGSTFLVTLPLPPVREVAAAPSPPPAGPDADRRGVLRILAAEDNEANQLVLQTLLAQAGIAPALVASGREALEAWDRERWDVILMDIQMPEMDGLAATRAIRAREQESGRARTPIVALTANAMSHQVTEYMAAGMDGVVAKPIQAAQLLATLDELLDPAHARAATPGAAAAR